MEENTLTYLIDKLKLAPIKIELYNHFHVEQIFPEAFYRELVENIPDISYFSQLEFYPQRSFMTLARESLDKLPFPLFSFCYKLALSLESLNFMHAIVQRFYLPSKERFGDNFPKIKITADTSVRRDQPGYSINLSFGQGTGN